jgi:hypothetical protein
MCGETIWGSGYDRGADGGVASYGSPMVASYQRRCTSRSNDSEKMERSEERQRCTSEIGETMVWGSKYHKVWRTHGDGVTLQYAAHCLRSLLHETPKVHPTRLHWKCSCYHDLYEVLTGLFGEPLACRVTRNRYRHVEVLRAKRNLLSDESWKSSGDFAFGLSFKESAENSPSRNLSETAARTQCDAGHEEYQ